MPLRPRHRRPTSDAAHDGCGKHPTTPVVGRCDRCRQGSCASCHLVAAGRSLCVSCAMVMAGVTHRRR